MYTSVAILALASFVAPSPAPFNQHWSGDYAAARKHAQKEQKPLAVFIGSGQKVAWDETLTEPIRKILTQKYVCVYVDTTKQNGRTLADEFEITKGLGLVISDRTGNIQAYHHDGGMESKALAARLQRFSDPDLDVQRTESNSRASYYPSAQNYTPSAPIGRSC